MLSFAQNIPIITEHIAQLMLSEVQSVCDVGCGMGKYGLLIKERYLSIKAEQCIVPTWDRTLIGVEDNRFFLTNSPLRYIYDDLYISSVFDYLPGADFYFFIDVIEHWTYEQTMTLFTKIKVPILIATPKQCVMYKEHYYGDSRTHITQWEAKHFQGWKDISTPLSHIYVRP